MNKIFRAIGLISGTSMDGFDLALIETDGLSSVKCGSHMSVDYAQSFRARLVSALQDARLLTNAVDRMERPGVLQPVEQQLTELHITAVKDFLQSNNLKPTDIDLLGFHGQTVLHRPENRLTVQLGLGEMLAHETGIACAYDFRTADVLAGGQGAPLVPVYHQALAMNAGLALPIAVVNLGGVGNVTYLAEDDTILAFDTGPGNALLDDWIMRHTGQPMDRDGAIAAKGMVIEDVLSKLLDNPYFDKKPPKSLDRNDFDLAPLLTRLNDMSLEDGAKTLTAFTAHSLARANSHLPVPPNTWIISGGGAQNPTLMAELKQHLSGKVMRADDISSPGQTANWSSSFMEAEAFAYLAVRVEKGLPITFPTTTGVEMPMTGGKIARP